MDLVQIKERMMNKKTVFLIAVGAGVLACLLLANPLGVSDVWYFVQRHLGRLFRNTRMLMTFSAGFAYILFSGFVLVMAITAIESIVFGAVAGGAVGLLGGYLGMVRILGFKISIGQLVLIVFPLLCGLYGFVIGKLCEAKAKTPDAAKTQSIKKVFFTAFIASLLMRLVPLILVTPRFPMGLETYPLPSFLKTIYDYEARMVINALRPIVDGLIVGIICVIVSARLSVMKMIRSVSASAKVLFNLGLAGNKMVYLGGILLLAGIGSLLYGLFQLNRLSSLIGAFSDAYGSDTMMSSMYSGVIPIFAIGVACIIAGAIIVANILRKQSGTIGETETTGEMVACSACGKEYYHKADKCPNCGKRNPRDIKAQRKYTILIIVIALIIGTGIVIIPLIQDALYTRDVRDRLDEELKRDADALRGYGIDPEMLEPGWEKR